MLVPGRARNLKAEEMVASLATVRLALVEQAWTSWSRGESGRSSCGFFVVEVDRGSARGKTSGRRGTTFGEVLDEQQLLSGLSLTGPLGSGMLLALSPNRECPNLRRSSLGAFLRQMVEVHTEMTEFLVSAVTRAATPRHRRQRDRSDGHVVMSDFATTISDLATAANRVIESKSDERADS